MDEITRRVDVGKGTFFHHFPTKDHVLAAYWDEFNGRIIQALEAIEEGTVQERLLAAVAVFGRAAKEEPAIGRVLLGRVFISSAMIHSDQENEAMLTAWLEGVLRDGVERKEVWADADLESFLYLFFSGLSNAFRDFLLFSGDDPAPLMSRRVRFLLRSLEVTDEPRE